MNKKGTSLNMSQTLKLYTGNSMLTFVLKFYGISILMYSAALSTLMLMLSIENGFTDAFEKLRSTVGSSFCAAMICGMISVLISSFTYEKNQPGGKFFRTAKGGSEIYKKMRTGMAMSSMISIMLCILTIYLFDLAGIFPLKYAESFCVSLMIAMLLASGLINLASMIKDDIKRALASVAAGFSMGFFGILSVELTDGKLGTPHIAAAVIAVILIPVSFRIMVSDYRKNRWNG